MSTTLSIILPAFNEAGRLPAYLDAIGPYLGRAGLDDYEVIVVDDGSRDGTADLVDRRAVDWARLSAIRLDRNRGKGAAVRAGVMAARHEFVLFADADGATPIEEEARLRAEIDAGADLAIGSRLASRSRAWHRGLTGRAFAAAVRLALTIPARDTQCGFKMFRRDVARRLFDSCGEEGYLFDLHVLALAARLGLRIAEVEVRWSEVPGSKVRLVRDSWRMLSGLPRLRRSVRAATPESHGWLFRMAHAGRRV